VTCRHTVGESSGVVCDVTSGVKFRVSPLSCRSSTWQLHHTVALAAQPREGTMPKLFAAVLILIVAATGLVFIPRGAAVPGEKEIEPGVVLRVGGADVSNGTNTYEQGTNALLRVRSAAEGNG